jgi:hypothetical protein
MSSVVKEYRYPLRLSVEDETAVARVVKQTGQSINQVLVVSIRKGLPLALKALCHEAGRVTAVDPLPDEVLEQAYSLPDDLDGVSAARLARFQSRRKPE